MHTTLAAKDVLAERARQRRAEGWTDSHDDEHDDRSLAKAAACYAKHAWRSDAERERREDETPSGWPWDWKWWKPKDRRRDLVRAAALILAEIERLDRTEQE